MNIVEIAESIAHEAHKGQLDKQGKDYIEHPARVAASVDGDVRKAIAWLHDVLEDTPVTYAELVNQVGIKVAFAVAFLSRNKEHETYSAYIERLATRGTQDEKAVKLADLRDNYARSASLPKLRVRYAAAIERLER